MDRPALFRSAELSRAAMDAATIAASFHRISPLKAERYVVQAEEALHAALDALDAARRGPAPAVRAVAACGREMAA